jgi:hypothetical protein
VLLIPNQTGDEYVMIGHISDLHNGVVDLCLRGVKEKLKKYMG